MTFTCKKQIDQGAEKQNMASMEKNMPLQAIYAKLFGNFLYPPQRIEVN